MPKYILLFTLLLSSVIISFAQSPGSFTTKNKKAIKLYLESDNYLIRRQYAEAIDLLEKSLKKDEKFLEAHNRLAAIHKTMNNLDAALVHYHRIKELKRNYPQFNTVFFDIAEVYLQKGDYSNVITYAKKYLETKPQIPEVASQCEVLIKNAEFAIEHIKKPLPVKPRSLKEPINKFQLQYFPVLTVDQQTMIFTRREGLTAQYDEDIFISKKDINGKWGPPEPISQNINSRYNEGTCTISADGRTLIFTACEGRKGFGSCDLFVSYRVGEEWSAPENLGRNINSSSWESQPALSADGRTLYFVSNRPGGYGKRDIWVSTKNEVGDWEPAKNCGPVINTAEDEVSPFIHVNGKTLYFSSKRYPSFGGFDLFYTEMGEKGWEKAVNMGYPINTADDQVSLFITADGTKGYYSHEVRNERGLNTSYLYEFDIPEKVQVKYKSNFVRGKVYDAETNKVLKARIELYDISNENLIGSVFSDSVSGEYLMVLTEGAEYALYVNKKGYLFESLSFDYLKENELKPVEINIYLKPLKTGMATILKNIFFEIDKYELKDKSKTELNKIVNFLKLNPTLKIEINGHTDNSGSKEYNRLLSLNRAKAVYQYLIDSGIECDRISVQGYGDTKPVAPNDTEQNKQKNRRIEFRIVK
jgi:OmpA-OmpF porin, OOP family